MDARRENISPLQADVASKMVTKRPLSDTIYPPKKRALYEHKLLHSIDNFVTNGFGHHDNRKENIQKCGKLDRINSFPRPRSDSLQSIPSVSSEQSESTLSTSREPSPLSHQEILDHQTPERNPFQAYSYLKREISKPLFPSSDNEKSPTNNNEHGSPEWAHKGARNDVKIGQVPPKLFNFQHTSSEFNIASGKFCLVQNEQKGETAHKTQNKIDTERLLPPGDCKDSFSLVHNIPKTVIGTREIDTQPMVSSLGRIDQSQAVTDSSTLNIQRKSDNGSKFEEKENLYCVKMLENPVSGAVLQNSTKSDLNVQGNQYKCMECGKSFVSEDVLRQHISMHKEKALQCWVCKAEFSATERLLQHMKTDHNGEKPYKCVHCSREFGQYNNLRRHLRVHREKQFKCNLCERKFNEEFYLKMHMSTHTGQRVYSCGVCNAGFPSSHELKLHVKTHSPSQLHTCNICGKSFSKACVLRQHKKGHSGERPHKCELCLKTFIHRHHLTMHLRSHTEQKLYVCDICNKEFSQSSHLYKHLRSHEEVGELDVEKRNLSVVYITDPSKVSMNIGTKHDQRLVKSRHLSENLTDTERGETRNTYQIGLESHTESSKITDQFIEGNKKEQRRSKPQQESEETESQVTPQWNRQKVPTAVPQTQSSFSQTLGYPHVPFPKKFLSPGHENIRGAPPTGELAAPGLPQALPSLPQAFGFPRISDAQVFPTPVFLNHEEVNGRRESLASPKTLPPSTCPQRSHSTTVPSAEACTENPSRTLQLSHQKPLPSVPLGHQESGSTRRDKNLAIPNHLSAVPQTQRFHYPWKPDPSTGIKNNLVPRYEKLPGDLSIAEENKSEQKVQIQSSTTSQSSGVPHLTSLDQQSFPKSPMNMGMPHPDMRYPHPLHYPPVFPVMPSSGIPNSGLDTFYRNSGIPSTGMDSIYRMYSHHLHAYYNQMYMFNRMFQNSALQQGQVRGQMQGQLSKDHMKIYGAADNERSGWENGLQNGVHLVKINQAATRSGKGQEKADTSGRVLENERDSCRKDTELKMRNESIQISDTIPMDEQIQEGNGTCLPVSKADTELGKNVMDAEDNVNDTEISDTHAAKADDHHALVGGDAELKDVTENCCTRTEVAKQLLRMSKGIVTYEPEILENQDRAGHNGKEVTGSKVEVDTTEKIREGEHVERLAFMKQSDKNEEKKTNVLVFGFAECIGETIEKAVRTERSPREITEAKAIQERVQNGSAKNSNEAITRNAENRTDVMNGADYRTNQTLNDSKMNENLLEQGILKRVDDKDRKVRSTGDFRMNKEQAQYRTSEHLINMYKSLPNPADGFLKLQQILEKEKQLVLHTEQNLDNPVKVDNTGEKIGQNFNQRIVMNRDECSKKMGSESLALDVHFSGDIQLDGRVSDNEHVDAAKGYCEKSNDESSFVKHVGEKEQDVCEQIAVDHETVGDWNNGFETLDHNNKGLKGGQVQIGMDLKSNTNSSGTNDYVSNCDSIRDYEEEFDRSRMTGINESGKQHYKQYWRNTGGDTCNVGDMLRDQNDRSNNNESGRNNIADFDKVEQTDDASEALDLSIHSRWESDDINKKEMVAMVADAEVLVEKDGSNNDTVERALQTSEMEKNWHNFGSPSTNSQHKHIQVQGNQCLLCHQTFTQHFDLQCHMLQHMGVNVPGLGKVRQSVLSEDSEAQADGTLDGRYNLVEREVNRDVQDNQRVNKTANAFSEVRTPKTQVFEINPLHNMGNSENVTSLKSSFDDKKTFKCDICSREFAQRHNLNRHKMSHNSKSHKCDICGRLFKEAFYLQMHIKIHSEETTVSCEICGQMVEKENIWTHTDRHYKHILKNPSYEQIGHRVHEILREHNS